MFGAGRRAVPLISSTARDGEYGTPAFILCILASPEKSLVVSFCNLQEADSFSYVYNLLRAALGAGILADVALA